MSKSLHPITIKEIENLSLDSDGNLYWKNKPVKTIDKIEFSAVASACVVLSTLAVLIQAGCEIFSLFKKCH